MGNPLEIMQNRAGVVATSRRVGPGFFPLGSVESRAAARALVQRKSRDEHLSPEMARAAIDPLFWLQYHTRTRDSHWREASASSPYRPFPNKPYFAPVIETIQNEPVLFIEKSRDMMISWLCVGYFTHAAMTVDEREVLFQSQKEDKAAELIDYAKTLYEQQHEQLKRRFPLSKPLKEQSALKLEFANGSRIIGIPEGADQIRSFHPWGLLMDEAAFQPEAGEAYDAAVPVCQKIIVVSSAGPGWFADFVTDEL
jgi:hypothetical protein